jgi:hypothetical protein
MAEELGWTIEDFHKAFQEILDQGLVKPDFNARVIFIPNAIKFNKPQSPNVVRSWASHWDEIPECELKDIARQSLKAFVEGMGPAFGEAFTEAIDKTMPNQEQEQEQEQEKSHIDVSGADSLSTSASQNCPHEKIIAAYHKALPSCRRIVRWNDTRRRHLQQRWKEDQNHQSMDFWEKFFGYVGQSKFLTGQVPGRDGKPPFVAGLDWLVKPDNFAKVIEGKYHLSKECV